MSPAQGIVEDLLEVFECPELRLSCVLVVILA